MKYETTTWIHRVWVPQIMPLWKHNKLTLNDTAGMGPAAVAVASWFYFSWTACFEFVRDPSNFLVLQWRRSRSNRTSIHINEPEYIWTGDKRSRLLVKFNGAAKLRADLAFCTPPSLYGTFQCQVFLLALQLVEIGCRIILIILLLKPSLAVHSICYTWYKKLPLTFRCETEISLPTVASSNESKHSVEYCIVSP